MGQSSLKCCGGTERYQQLIPKWPPFAYWRYWHGGRAGHVARSKASAIDPNNAMR